MEELRKEYGMDDEDAKELQNKMDKVISHALFDGEHPPKILVNLNLMTSVFQDAAERDAAKEKVEQKMEVQDIFNRTFLFLLFAQAFKG